METDMDSRGKSERERERAAVPHWPQWPLWLLMTPTATMAGAIFTVVDRIAI